LTSFNLSTSSSDVNQKNKLSTTVVFHQETSNWLELDEDVSLDPSSLKELNIASTQVDDTKKLLSQSHSLKTQNQRKATLDLTKQLET
jgi:hypothetical protein